MRCHPCRDMEEKEYQENVEMWSFGELLDDLTFVVALSFYMEAFFIFRTIDLCTYFESCSLFLYVSQQRLLVLSISYLISFFFVYSNKLNPSSYYIKHR